MSSSFTQFQQNVQRQSREQKAVGSLLSGVAAILIGGIVLVGTLALVGGWVLWGQINDQSRTVAQLDAKVSGDITNLQNSLRETVAIVEKLAAQNQAQFQAQKQQVTTLQHQVDDIKSQFRKEKAANQTALQNLQRRVFELERR
ncbi:MAG: hypothetical protein PHV34_09690 [Verrucomicrobiae bacterium]|nr:hypothetical protein [Verrucomicrobiae bacterium]